jgi:hypothetical protein
MEVHRRVADPEGPVRSRKVRRCDRVATWHRAGRANVVQSSLDLLMLLEASRNRTDDLFLPARRDTQAQVAGRRFRPRLSLPAGYEDGPAHGHFGGSRGECPSGAAEARPLRHPGSRHGEAADRPEAPLERDPSPRRARRATLRRMKPANSRYGPLSMCEGALCAGSCHRLMRGAAALHGQTKSAASVRRRSLGVAHIGARTRQFRNRRATDRNGRGR